MTKEQLEQYLKARFTLKQIAEIETLSLPKLRQLLRQWDLSPARPRSKNWDTEKLRQIAEVAESKRDVLRKMGKRDTGSNYTMLNKLAEQLDIALPVADMSKAVRLAHRAKNSPEAMLAVNTNWKAKTLRRLLIEHCGVPYACNRCNLSTWLGEPIVLEVDHVNGIHTDNRALNLRFLCPNCHSLTPTNSRKKNHTSEF